MSSESATSAAIGPTSTYCNSCSSIEIGRNDSPTFRGLEWPATINNIISSTRCPLCTQIRDSLRRFHPEGQWAEKIPRPRLWANPLEDKAKRRPGEKVQYKGYHFLEFQRSITPIVRFTILGDEPSDSAHALGKTVKPAADLSFLLDKLHECETSHPGCHDTEIFPVSIMKQLYFVDVIELRLVLAPFVKDSFAVLSYTWGGDIKMKTTRKLLKQYTSALPSPLPKTYRDAIFSTKRAGIRYLWVDALCIIQDDADDKGEKIHQMDLIYALAKFTLVTATGSNAESGLGLENRQLIPTLILPSGLRLAQRNPADDWRTSVWFTRAWTFQEYLFSRRLLIFTPTSVHYRCILGGHIEDGEAIDVAKREDFRNEEIQKKHDGWPNMVRNYTDRKITFPSDLLAAITGVANITERLYTGQKIVKGLITDPKVLSVQILWQSINAPSTVSAVNIASLKLPSWSWARFIGPIACLTSHYPKLSEPRATVSVVETGGEVELLQITGDTIWVDIGRRLVDAEISTEDSEILDFPWLLEPLRKDPMRIRISMKKDKARLETLRVVTVNGRDVGVVDFDDVKTAEGTKRVYCMKISQTREDEDESVGEWNVLIVAEPFGKLSARKDTVMLARGSRFALEEGEAEVVGLGSTAETEDVVELGLKESGMWRLFEKQEGGEPGFDVVLTVPVVVVVAEEVVVGTNRPGQDNALVFSFVVETHRNEQTRYRRQHHPLCSESRLPPSVGYPPPNFQPQFRECL